jgi:hypothetical protein
MNKTAPNPAYVSIHGGHSGDFCCHALDSLEDMVKAYIKKGFAWVGISEHMPPVTDAFLYPEERAAGWDAGRLYDQYKTRLAKPEIAHKIDRNLALIADRGLILDFNLAAIILEFRP